KERRTKNQELRNSRKAQRKTSSISLKKELVGVGTRPQDEWRFRATNLFFGSRSRIFLCALCAFARVSSSFLGDSAAPQQEQQRQQFPAELATTTAAATAAAEVWWIGVGLRRRI